MPQAPNLFPPPKSNANDPVAAARAKLAAAQAAHAAAKPQREPAPLKSKTKAKAAPAPVVAEDDEEFIDDDEAAENGIEASEDAVGFDDDDDDAGEPDESDGDDENDDASAAPVRRGRGRPAGAKGEKAPTDPVLVAALDSIRSQAARKVVRVIGFRLFTGLRGRQAAVSAAAPSHERDLMLEALATMEAAFENLAATAAQVRQDWTLRRATTPRVRTPANWQPTPGTLVRLNPAFAEAYSDFVDPDSPAKVIKILPGNTALVLSAGTKVPVPFAVLVPDQG